MDGVQPRYAAFGGLVVRRPEGEHEVTRSRERDVLAVLLAQRAPVSADLLLAEVWDFHAALGSLQAVISRLRALLEPGRGARGENRCLVSTSAGYALRADPDQVDTWHFEDLTSRCIAESDPSAVLELQESAEALWVGAPYAGSDTESVRAARARLVELRAAVAERAGQALLDLGHSERAILLLTPRISEHPFRERLSALLAVAQYRGGRQSEALATLRAVRTRLADELGVDPTPELRQLEQDLLQQSPSLEGPASSLASRASGARAAAAASRPASRDDAELLGREAPLARVTELIAGLRDTGPRVLSVLGEPGVGKTRFVLEVLQRAADRGLSTVVGQCHEGDVAPALWPWTQVVRAVAASGTETDPLLAPLLGDGAVVDTGSGSLRLFDAVATLLHRAARERDGLVVVLEDVHWADTTSLQLLAHVAETTAAAPLLLVTTRRSSEEPGSNRMVETLAALARVGAERLRLDGLERPEVGRLLARLLGRERLPGALVEQVDEATAGNSFFIEEYARLLQTLDDPAAAGGAGGLPVPDGVRDVIGQRVSRLPEPAAALLRAVSVLGRDIEPDDAAALVEQPLDHVLDHLDLALATGLLRERDRGYTFAHALTREALYADLSAARRVRLHARAADVLAARLGEDPDASADIAHHAAIAAPLDADHGRRAFIWLGRAARVALARQAPLEARGLWERARSLAAAQGLQDERLHAMLGVAHSAVRMGTFTEAPGLVKELAQEASRLGHWDLVAAAAATFQDAGAWTWRMHGTTDEELIEVFTRALDHVTGVDEVTLCATLTIEHQFGWDIETSDAYAARAIAVAREAGDLDQIRSALLARLISSCGRADLGPRSPLAQELVDTGPTGPLEVTALFHAGYALHEEGRVDEAITVVARAQEKASTMTHSGLEVPLAWWEAAVARDHDAPDAERLGDEALALLLGQGFYHGTELPTLHAVLHRRPGSRVADSVIEDARAGLHAQRPLVAWSLVESGDLDLAAELLGEPPPAHAVDYSIEASLCLRLLVAAALDDTVQVAEMLRRIDRYTIPLAVYGTVLHLGAFDHFRALGRRTLGEHDRALQLARSAVETNRRCDIRPWLRRSEALLAELAGHRPG